jgi:hypothetical protein
MISDKMGVKSAHVFKLGEGKVRNGYGIADDGLPFLVLEDNDSITVIEFENQFVVGALIGRLDFIASHMGDHDAEQQ